jgi:GTPase SAR1 family protein
MEERFIDLWNWLSPEGIALGNLYELLRADTRPLPPQKLSQGLPTYPGLAKRNELEIELDILGEMFLQDIVRAKELEDDFLRECYCTSGALSQYALVSKDILRSRYHETVNRKSQTVTNVRSPSGISSELLASVAQRGLSRRPIVLLGDVGVGKTTFIRHLVKVDARDELEGSIVFYVDFGTRPALRRDLEAFVREAFAEQLLSDYHVDIYTDDFIRAVYEDELQRFAQGIYGRMREQDPTQYLAQEIGLLGDLSGNLEGHLQRSLGHLHTQGRSAVAFFDNIDQRDVEFQDAVYLIAQSLAETWGMITFISLRPETFNRSRRTGSLAAYQPRVFTISPPQIDQVVRRRLIFAQEVIAAGRFKLSNEGVTIDSPLLRDYIQVVIDSLNHNDALCECLDNISRGNVRRALDLLTTFVGSGHVDTRKIIDIYRERNAYTVPLHEFLRAIIYADHQYYDPSASAVPNVFAISSRNGREHFAVLILLNYLERQARYGAVELGYVLLAQAYDFLQSVGFNVEEIDITVGRAVEGGLVESSVGAASDRPVGAERLRPTQTGAYMLHRLVRMFVYSDAVVVDTPVLDSDVRANLGDAQTIEDRLLRANRFLAYLDARFAEFGGLDTGLDWADIARAVKRDIEEISARVERVKRRALIIDPTEA